MIYRIITHPLEVNSEETFYTFLDSALSLIVGIEFLKMIIIPTSQNVIETLLFAVARTIILEHSSPVVLSVGVLSVTILFIIKKFLITEFREEENTYFSGNTLVTKVNLINKCNLPILKNYKTIGELMKYELERNNQEVQRYSQIRIEDVMLVALKISNNNITKVEVTTIEDEEEIL